MSEGRVSSFNMEVFNLVSEVADHVLQGHDDLVALR
jgi:hypothetical protein